jgi:adenylate cyclase class 2
VIAGAREIEVKYRVGGVDGLWRALVARGAAVGATVRQDDQAYAPVGWSYGDSKLGVAFARLRTQDGRRLFTVKRPLENELACLEHETEVLTGGRCIAQSLGVALERTSRTYDSLVRAALTAV